MIVKCKHCGKDFNAKPADVKRGWGKFCSKSCKAIEQEKRTGQFAELQERLTEDLTDEQGWDAHKSV